MISGSFGRQGTSAWDFIMIEFLGQRCGARRRSIRSNAEIVAIFPKVSEIVESVAGNK